MSIWENYLDWKLSALENGGGLVIRAFDNIDSVGFCPDEVGEIGKIGGLSGKIFLFTTKTVGKLANKC